MSEPKAVAETVEAVVPGVWRWHVWDDRIDFESDAHAVSDGGGTVLIDPLPLRENALKKLEPIIAICLTAACHQRSAWRYRRAYGVQVYAPEGCRAMNEEPDLGYRVGEMLPGGLKAIHTPGPEQAHYAFWRERTPSAVLPGSHHARRRRRPSVHSGGVSRRSPGYPRQRAASARSAVRCALHGPRSTYHRKPARGPAKADRLMYGPPPVCNRPRP
jgi:hypothetical protein